MEIEELMKLKEQIMKEYNEEKAIYNQNNLSENDKAIILDELNDIEKEQRKVEELIKIYQNQDQNYRVMRLERLYMMVLSGLNEKEFNALNEDKKFQLFDKYFPSEWVLDSNIDTKEDLLLTAISKNRVIDISKNKKRIYSEYEEE